MGDDGKIQQYVLLAKGARGRALGELISKATGEQGLFGFGELLSMPNVQEVGQGAAASLHTSCIWEIKADSRPPAAGAAGARWSTA